jgi:hypothetical protein
MCLIQLRDAISRQKDKLCLLTGEEYNSYDYLDSRVQQFRRYDHMQRGPILLNGNVKIYFLGL